MATLRVTGEQLDAIGFNRVSRYILFPRKGYHIRVDFAGNAPAGSFNVSSFHVKRDIDHQTFFSTTEGSKYFNRKIIEDETDYVYFKYVDGGVWQPIWGYCKEEQMSGGQSIWKQTGDIDREAWSFACNQARWFLDRLGQALGEGREQGLAMGPIQSPDARMFNQL